MRILPTRLDDTSGLVHALLKAERGKEIRDVEPHDLEAEEPSWANASSEPEYGDVGKWNRLV